MLNDLIIAAKSEHTVNGYTWRIGDRFIPTVNTDKLLVFDRGVITAINEIYDVATGQGQTFFTVRLTNIQAGENDLFTIGRVDTLVAY